MIPGGKTQKTEFSLSRWLLISRRFLQRRFGDPPDPRYVLFSRHRCCFVLRTPAEVTGTKCQMVNSARGGGEILNQLLT